MTERGGIRAVIFQLTYFSRSLLPPETHLVPSLQAILDSSQRNNRQQHVTGFLMFEHPWFVQVLEGEHADVTATFRRIEADPRHCGAFVISTRDVRRRSFPNWSMGGVVRTPAMENVYRGHGVDGPIEPASLTAPQILMLALDLQNFQNVDAARLQLAS